MWLLLILAILGTVATVAVALLITLANMMSDAPGGYVGYRSLLIPGGISVMLFAAWWTG